MGISNGKDLLGLDIKANLFLNHLFASAFNICLDLALLWRIDSHVNKRLPKARYVRDNDIVRRETDKEAKDPCEGIDLPRSAHVESILDRLGKAGKERSDANEEGNERPPVEAMAVVVDAMVAVELVDVQLPLLD